MDYTKIPAALIYRQRQSLDEFIDSNNLIAALVDNMLEIDYLNKNDFERFAKDGLNAAFYICTIIMLEKRPEWRWTFYLNEADYNHETAWDIYDGQEFVMALVYVLLRRFNKEWSDAHQPLMKRLFEYNFPDYRFDNNPGERAYLDSIHKIIGKLIHKLPAGNLPDDIFAPCDINDDAIKEAEMDMAQANMRWQDITNNFDQKTTKILMDAICKNETERIFLALAIGTDATNLGMSENVSYLRPFFRKAIGMPAPDSADEQIDDLLWPPQIPEEDIDNATAEAEGNTGVESNSDEVVVLKARNKELEAENEQLKRIKELENIVTSSEGGEVETKPDWIDWFDDDVFKPNFNAEKIAEAIKVIAAPHLSTHCYWYVVYRVLDKIRWLADGVTQKAFLKWANAHFSYGWKGEQQFKFSEINDSIKKVADIDDWDEYTMKTNQGQYYAELRDKLYKVFVEKLPNGKLFDRTEFIKQGQQRVNNGH